MATVRLDAEDRPSPVPLLPRRVRLGRGALELLADLGGTPLPWTRTGVPPEPAAESAAESGAELREAGLLGADGAPLAEVADALGVLAAPDVTVDLDLALVEPAVHLRSWQRLRRDRVAALSTAGGPVELAWHCDRGWAAELARAVRVHPGPRGRPGRPGVTGRPGPPGELRLPHELLLGTAEARRLGRPDLFATLVAGRAVDAERLWRLHADCRGRLRVVVAGRGSGGARTAGWLSWVLHDDGWRALTPYVDRAAAGPVAMVRVHPRTPGGLGPAVAALVGRVRA